MGCVTIVAMLKLNGLTLDDSGTKISLLRSSDRARCSEKHILLMYCEVHAGRRFLIIDMIGSPHTELARITVKHNGDICLSNFSNMNFLSRDARHSSLRVTQKGWGVLNRGDQFWGFPVKSINRVTPKMLPEYSPQLFELLRTERDRIAAIEGVLFYEVFHDKALQAMATYFPTSEESFRLMPGVGSTKSEKYAEIFLPIIREYFKAQGTYLAESTSDALYILETTFQESNEYALELFERLPY